LAEAKKVLSGQEVALVFCDDRLIDGSYRDLLQTLQVLKITPHFVLTTRIGEWRDSLEALSLGVFDMIESPYRSTDIELSVIRAMRDGEQQSDRMIA
jgi:DNA-binding NtrC family response regulator